MLKVAKYFFILLITQLSITNGYSQDLLNNKNISQIQVDQISEADIMKFQSQLKASNISIAEAQQIAIARGMPATEVAKLKNRLDNLSQSNSLSDTIGLKGANSQLGRNIVPTNSQIVSNSILINSKIFGSELFTSNSLTFEPNLHLATPLNYILGSDDALQISVYGLQETNISQTVSPEGTISIPTVGIIRVGGLSIENATSLIKSRMAQVGYRSLWSGASKISVSLTKIRSISITIVGAVKSGNYTISSLSTLFNALFLSGGPGSNRSFRQIELIRENRLFKIIDLYKFLITGDESDNVSLKDNDIIRLPIYKTRIEISGEVKRAGIFEMLNGESFADLLKFTGGFSDSAYRASVKVIQLTNKERQVADISEVQFSDYFPRTGDFFEVSKILNRFSNRVTIEGAVFRPGTYQITNDLTISQLIKNAEGLTEDALTQRAQIIRLKEDNSKEIISVDLVKAKKGSVDDIKLNREDKIIIFSVLNLKDQYTITIEGEVRKPGEYFYNEGTSLKDLIIFAGGFTYAAYPQRIEIARLIKRDKLTTGDQRLSEIIDVENVTDLTLNNKNIPLQPFDVVTIRKIPGYNHPELVQVSGEVQFPGPYALSSRLEKVTDLIKRSGGFSPEAYSAGAYLKRRKETTDSSILNKKIAVIQKKLKDSSDDVSNSIYRSYDLIPLDLNNILANPKSEYNLIVKPGDELVIPRNDMEIRVSGEVFSPTQSPFLEGKSLKYYINNAGGYTENAKRKRIYLLYANGKAVATKHFFFIHKFPKVQPGAEIVVPKANSKRKMSTAETVGIFSALASLMGVIIAIIQVTKK